MGSTNSKFKRKYTKKLNEIFSSIKFIKVTNKELFFLKYKKRFLENARISILYELAKSFPRPLF